MTSLGLIGGVVNTSLTSLLSFIMILRSRRLRAAKFAASRFLVGCTLPFPAAPPPLPRCFADDVSAVGVRSASESLLSALLYDDDDDDAGDL